VSLHRRGRPSWATESIERDARPTFHSKTARRLQNLEVTIMTDSPDTRHYAAEFALLEALVDDGPSLEELSLRNEIDDQGAQIAELKAERDAAVNGSRELAGENTMLCEALARVVALVMQGAEDPITDALDVLEAAGLTLPEPVDASRRHLAVAA
jgi:hypothetical protein